MLRRRNGSISRTKITYVDREGVSNPFSFIVDIFGRHGVPLITSGAITQTVGSPDGGNACTAGKCDTMKIITGIDTLLIMLSSWLVWIEAPIKRGRLSSKVTMPGSTSYKAESLKVLFM